MSSRPKITCSIGELFDKYSILMIKKEKIEDKIKKKNIKSEMELLYEENEILRSETNLNYINNLYKINLKLWNLEDKIREKSSKKEFDNEYLSTSENIHITNDLRYKIKNDININLNSFLREEKEYNFCDIKDRILLNKGKLEYKNGKYTESLIILTQLVKKYNFSSNLSPFKYELMFCYISILLIFNLPLEYINEVKFMLKIIDSVHLSINLKEYCLTQIGYYYLNNHLYINSYPYLHLQNYISSELVPKDKMNFFKEFNINKILFIYDAGGLGDNINYSRFIPYICNKYKSNKIIWGISDKLHWIFKKLFKDIKNLKIVDINNKKEIPLDFDYYCNTISLIKFLKLKYSDILNFSPIDLKEVNGDTSFKNKIKEFKSQYKYIFILNWKGNINNSQEKYNRKMNLKEAIPLFQIPNIKWIALNKDVTEEESYLLKKYNVLNLGKEIDNTNDAFKNTISILKMSNCCFSTDTSFLHLSAGLKIKTVALLTLGPYWLWNGEISNWYPNITLIKQKELGNWNYVIKSVEKFIKEIEIIN